MNVKVKGQIVTQTGRVPVAANSRDFAIRIGCPGGDKRKKISSFGLIEKPEERKVWFNGLFADVSSLNMASSYRVGKDEQGTKLQHKIVKRRYHTAKDIRRISQLPHHSGLLDAGRSFSVQTSDPDPDYIPTELELSGEGLVEEGSQTEQERATLTRAPTQKVYLRVCQTTRTAPSKRLIRDLTTPAINIQHRSLRSRDIKACAVALMSNVSVHEVNLSNNMIDAKGCEYLSEMLRENVNITHLILSNNRIKLQGLNHISKALIEYDRIRVLDLSNNGLTDEASECIANIIKENQLLTHLYLNKNQFGEDGGVKISHSLRKNDSLEVLEMAWNHLRNRGGAEIGKAIEVNSCLMKLNLAWNGLGLAGCRELGKSLAVNNVLKELDLTCNRLDDASLSLLLKGLKENTSLATLRIGRNTFTSEASLQLLKSIRDTPTIPIQLLDMQDQIVDTEFLDLKQLLMTTRQMTIHHGIVKSAVIKIKREDFDKYNDPMQVFMEFLRLSGTKLSGAEDTMTMSPQDLKLKLMRSNIPLGSDKLDTLIRKLDSPEIIDIGLLNEKLRDHRKLLHSLKKKDQDVVFEETSLGKMSEKLQRWLIFKKPESKSRRKSTVPF